MASTTVFYFLAAVLLASSSAQPYRPYLRRNVLTVTSTGKVSVSTTIIEIHMTITARGKTALEAQKKLLASTRKILRHLELKKVSKLGITAGVISPTYNNYSPTASQNVTGYTGTGVLKFETSISRIGSVFDGNVLTKATGTITAGFKGSYGAIRKARLAALYIAIKTAEKEAKIAALAAGRRIGRAVNIQFGTFSASPLLSSFPFYSLTSSRSLDARKLASNSQPIQATVTVTYATY